MKGMGIKQSAQSRKTELNILFRKPQRPDTDSAIAHKRGVRVKTIHASGVEMLPISPASEPDTYIMPLPYSATLVAFYLLDTMSKNLKLKALSIMSFPVSSHTVVVATME